jgi:hypothetical protein
VTKRLLKGDDLTLPGMIDRAETTIAAVPILPPPEKPVAETGDGGRRSNQSFRNPTHPTAVGPCTPCGVQPLRRTANE